MIKLSQPIITDEAIASLTEVLKSGMLVQGKYVERFEKELSNFLTADYAVAVSSGTAALHIALSALEITEGDAVFVPAFTFPATVNVVELQRATPILIDVESDTYNIDPIKLEEAITNYTGKEKLKAIIVVHEFGASAHMTAIMEIARKYSLYVIEDAACALGTKWEGKHVGTIGDVGCFSFHPRKTITTGEGGLIVVKSEILYEKALLLRNHGIKKSKEGQIDFLLPGFNYRLTDFQALLGLYQIKELKTWLQRRKEVADKYFESLKEVKGFSLPEKVQGHAWQTFMIVLSEEINRDEIMKKMYEYEIETNIGAQAIHLQSYYRRKYQFNEDYFPITKKLFFKGLALPIHQGLNNEDVQKVISTIYRLMG